MPSTVDMGGKGEGGLLTVCLQCRIYTEIWAVSAMKHKIFYLELFFAQCDVNTVWGFNNAIF